MQNNCSHTLAVLALALGLGAHSTQAAAPAQAQGTITAKAFLDISGTAVAGLTGSPKFPDNPDVIQFPTYFEWAATGDIFTAPGNWGNNYGTQIVGYFHAPANGDYIFWVAADDNAELYLSTDADPKNKKRIARESNWSNPRQYLESGGNSNLTMKDSSQFVDTQWPTKDPVLGGAKITLRAGQAYYIEALSKEGGGGDNLSVSVLDPGFTIDSTLPIPGRLLSSDRATGPASIVAQPKSQTVDERGSVTLRVLADGTPPYKYQWKKNGADITDATEFTYTLSNAAVADNNAKYSVVVTGAQGSVTSQEAVITVTPDTIPPKVLLAKGSPNLTEVVLTFSEKLDNASASAVANYRLSAASGTLNVTAATLSENGTQVTLTTARQTLGTKYTLLISNIKDTAATPNSIAPNSKAVFFPTGKLIEQNGFIVFEAENYDRNNDGLWLRDTTRGNPSGGASMVNPNGLGGNESNTKLEYDVEFKQAATYVVWYRASGNDGSDDSAWFHIDGQRPVERAASNDAAMTGFSGALDFVWRTDSFTGPDPFTVDIAPAGPHVVGLARREDGSFFDKFILTTDTAFVPSGFGPPETREGAPGAPTVSISGPAEGKTFATGANIPLTVNAAGASTLEILSVEYTANGTVIGETTTSPFGFTWNSVPNGIYVLRAKVTDEIGQSKTSDAVTITVGTPPPQAVLIGGTSALNASDAGVKARLESQGWQVRVIEGPATATSNADGVQLIITSSTVSSGDVAAKFRNVPVPVINWEQALQDDYLMTGNGGTDRGETADPPTETQINIIRADHPLAAKLPAGPVTISKSPVRVTWGSPNENAVKIATVAGNPDQVSVYGYDTGATMIDGTFKAPARRVHIFLQNSSFEVLTDAGLALFDAAVSWASGVKPPAPKSSANIAWISFHPASDRPGNDAAGAGFTKAADVAYTDLLTSKGHKVTRFVTSGTPDTAVLNTFDLVIVSRSVPSGDYQDPPETAAWNGIKAPMMILGGYVLRANRLGLMTGNTIPDTGSVAAAGGPVRLTVNNPSHPIFAGIALDAAKTMVNLFADVVTFNSTAQRGISVVTDPPAGDGTVLATVGTAGDLAFGGMVIGEWKAGATVGSGRDTLGGPRLVFLTGSREQGFTSQGAGIYDLSADGAQMFLNAVNYMAGTVPSQNPTLSVARTAAGLSITYTGTLQSADAITGPWTDVTGATSPLAVTTSQGQKFYRSKQ